jgi:phosphate transport system permease protein
MTAPRRRAARLADPSFKALTLAAGLVVLAVLAAIVFVTFNKSWPVWTEKGIGFAVHTGFQSDRNAGGLIFGTLVTSALALVIGVPVAVGCALYLTEMSPRRVRRPLAWLVELLAAVPSVVYGLWGAKVLAPWLYRNVTKPVNNVIPGVFANRTFAVSGSYLLGGIVLAVMILPIMTAIMREVFRQVPESQREAATALGATRWETIRIAVLPYGRSGIIGAIVIGLGRALGETIALALTVGSIENTSIKIFSPGDTLAARIANSYNEAGSDLQAALIGLAAILLVITLAVNVVARRFVRSSSSPVAA